MKKIISNLIVFILVYNLQISAQQYFSLPDSNAVWTIGGLDYGGNPPPLGFYVKYKYQGDTVINENSYKKVYEYIFSNFNLVYEWYYVAIRESNNKWFFVYNNDSIERLLYDFTLQTGDTARFYVCQTSGEPPILKTFIVSNVDSILINNQYRKRLWIGNYIERWIVGIGSISGLFFSNSYQTIDGGTLLLCFKYTYPHS